MSDPLFLTHPFPAQLLTGIIEIAEGGPFNAFTLSPPCDRVNTLNNPHSRISDLVEDSPVLD